MPRTPLGALAALALTLPAPAQTQKITPPDPQVGAWYGYQVAVDGAYAAVGEPRHQLGPLGRAHFLRHDGSGWLVDDVVESPSGVLNDQFGFAVDVDGWEAVVGAKNHQGPSGHTGKAYTFRRELKLFPLPPAWELTAELECPFPDPHSRFGESVAIDGNFAAVGAPDYDFTANDTGLICVYRRQGSTWVIDDVIVAFDLAADAHYGRSVALNGPTLFVGAPGDDDAGPGTGAVYVYRHDGTGWNLDGKILAPTPAAGESFGQSVSAAGSRVLIGATGEGRAHVYRRELNLFPLPPSWEHRGTLVPFFPSASDNFGASVSLTGDELSGEYHALVGANREDGEGIDAGAAFHFETIGGTWIQRARLFAPDAQDHDNFGLSVAHSGDRALVGSPFSNGPPGQGDSGAVYAFSLAPPAIPFHANTKTLSVGSGGTQTMFLQAGAQHVGKIFFVLGTVSGTSPGTVIANALVPLNQDFYFDFSLFNPSVSPLVHTIGLLDAPAGTDTAGFELFPGSSQNLIGLELHHAYVVLGAGPIDFVSDPVALTLVP